MPTTVEWAAPWLKGEPSRGLAGGFRPSRLPDLLRSAAGRPGDGDPSALPSFLSWTSAPKRFSRGLRPNLGFMP